ncbi:hypothetical protein [Devosia sp. SL43]|uniref:hypothetical protein n=1 Tax=Devosia sp. SL43 TaxID=2806348 RepID=UPI001F3F5032|nr:hypothetical protein [Devosia sp. SL43]UJW84550.1 hypothetical protein IM737_14095 [Devosia sp. SL43]
MRLARFALVSGLAVATIATILAISSQVQDFDATRREQVLVDQSIDQLLSSSELSDATARIKFDVVQVQQWLTDISATRGLDGLDDGFDQAANYAAAFAADLATARALALELDDAEMLAAIDGLNVAFEPYYATGQRMAQAFVESGPAGGNALMGEFDATAETITGELDRLQGISEAYRAHVQAVREDNTRTIAAARDHQALVQVSTFGVLVIFIVLMTLFVAVYVLRRLRSISAQLLTIAEGDYSLPVYGSRSWDELKAIASAAEVFRHNGLRLAEMSAEEIAQSTARRQERAAMMQSLQDAFGEVVDAAVAGDFGKRVPAGFQDEVLNRLAGSVNHLVQTIDTGLAETTVVLSGLARYQLGLRMTGDFQGAFARLRDDTNAVAEISNTWLDSCAPPHGR